MFSRKLLTLGVVAVLGLGAAALIVVSLSVTAAAEEKLLFEKVSPYNTILVTEDEQGLRTLRFEKGGTRQSVVKLGDPDYIEFPYARAMTAGLALVEKPQRVLIVGLGGGTIPNFLHKHYPRMTIDVVDIDPDVVNVARRFFGFREDHAMRAHVGDGRRFIEQCRQPYDIIFLDAFGSENIPYHLATREFLQAVRKAITPQGVVVANVFGRGSNSLHDSMVRTYQDVFDQLYIFDVEGASNEVLVAMPSKQRIERDELLRRAGEISRERQFPFDMARAVTYGCRQVRAEQFHGRVLVDKDDVKEAASVP